MFKVVAIVLVAIGVALLLEHVIVEVRTTIRWLFAAVFLALALSPLVDLIERARIRGRGLPRWLATLVAYVLFFALLVFLILAVVPPIVREIEQLGSQLPTYVKDFENWAEGNEQFRELNDKYDITKLLSQEASQLPARLGDVAGGVRDITVGLLNNLVEAIVVLTLSFFLLLDGGKQFERATGRLRADHRNRVRRAGERIARIVRSYVSVNLTLAALAGVFTWLALELLGVDLAVPLAVLVAILDLVPLIGFTIGGLLVAVVAALHDFPVALIVWAALFLIYQQLQDRVIQPIFYRSAVRIHPVIAIVAVLAGAQLAGILGALLAIPVAAALGVIYDELWPAAVGSASEEDEGGDGSSEPEPEPAPASG
ncbi:MAG: AI-2E family transporter [Solirubrobacterales bacterium]